MKIELFKKFDFSKRELDKEKLYGKIVRFARIILFATLVVMELIVLFGGVYGHLFWVIFALEIMLAVNFALKSWVISAYNKKIICYVADTLLLLSLTALSGNEYLSTLFMIVLTEFYISVEKVFNAFMMFIFSLLLYSVANGLSLTLREAWKPTVGAILSQSFNSVVFLSIHFLVVNFAIAMYRYNLQISKKNEELDDANKKLQSAYKELHAAEMLRERQRIAKDIHDTAGHSITICIMQTEAAKMLMDTDLEEAKKNVVSANLQAKHALEELRESVHLLSDRKEQTTLRDSLLNVITDSTSGTGIKIRSLVEDVSIPDESRRLVENTLKEGISNGLRHGKATAFYFELTKKGNEVCFLLSDNGVGVELSRMKDGLGLGGLKRRVAECGGSVEFVSEIDEGFEIRMTLPLQEGENV